MKYTLYNYWRSSASWRVRIGLHWKGVPFTYVPVHLAGGEQYQAEHQARNPQGMVPVLEIEDGGPGKTRHLAQSLAILEYLEATSPAPPFLPRDPYLAARARQLAEIINSGIQPFHNMAVLKRVAALPADDQAWGRGFIERGLAAFARAASETAGSFCIGDTPTLADLMLVPQLYGARRLAADLTPFPRLLEIEARCAELPAFQAAHADRQPDALPT
jgi:maleylpyruvate isomerase